MAMAAKNAARSSAARSSTASVMSSPEQAHTGRSGGGHEAGTPDVAPSAAAAVAAAAAAAAASGMSSPERAHRQSSSDGLAGTPNGSAGGTSLPAAGPSEPLPCVIFLHGNSSCCLEALPLLTLLSPLSISLFCFDFSGCGLSEGEYISLGWFERDDLATCVDYLRSIGRISTIALWGRSMGAFTALLHADRDPSIAGLVLDSPFISLSALAEELARGYAKVPAWMARAVLVMVRSMIQAKAHFDIDLLEAVDHVSRSFSPALFVAAHGDDFILPHHASKLYEAYQGEKELRMVDGDHNSVRPEAFRREAVLFLCRAFHSERLDRLLQMHMSGLYDIFAGVHRLPGAVGTDSRGSGEDGATIVQQMQVFPTLRSMRLFHRKKCHRPLSARVSMKLQQDHAEAGLFVAFDPETSAGDTHLGLGIPRFLILSVSSQAMVLSRVCADSLQSMAASTGLQARQARQLMFEIDRDGNLRAQLGSDPAIECAFGKGYREQVTLWLMVLRGQTSFGPLTAEDGEATIRESLGDAVLYHRHLGPGKPPPSKPLPNMAEDVGLATPCRRLPGRGVLPEDGPAAMPRGDMGLLSPKASPCPSSAALLWPEQLPLPRSMTEITTTVISPPRCTPLATERDAFSCREDFPANHNAQDTDALTQSPRATVADLCATKPEALIGWRVLVDSMGEGLVVGIKRRLGRSTQHIVSWSDAKKAKDQALAKSWSHTRSDGDLSSNIVLQRKERHKRRCHGHSFEVLKREF